MPPTVSTSEPSWRLDIICERVRRCSRIGRNTMK
jgi:hypothetical protein